MLAALWIVQPAFARPERRPSKDVASPQDIEARTRLGSVLRGKIVFDSNRSGTFGIYTIDLQTGDISPLVDTDRTEMYPDPSPDGTQVVFSDAKSDHKKSESSIAIVPATGGAARKLADDGMFPTFSSDGTKIYFERQRSKIIRLDLASGKEEEIFPKGHPDWVGKSVIKPRISTDGKYAVFISEEPRRWSSWFVELASGKGKYVGPGCEPGWFPAGDRVMWITGVDAKERSGIAAYSLKDGKVEMVQDADAPRGHEYFPSLAEKGRFLLFSAARPKEHKPTSANYQVFVKDLQENTLTRVTFDRYTNRWPKLLRMKD